MTGDLAVYVHWPFCAAICPYCDFNVHKDRGADAVAWTRALTAELQHWAALTPGRRVASLYFGGGTPSLAPLSVIEAVIAAADRLWGFADDPEITLEANPVDAARFAEFRGAGVNRLSLGVQSFDDAALKFLGRDHDGAGARAALDAALVAFPRASADLIYALPGQTLPQWTEELAAALATGVRHLSLYQLTIEPGTAFDAQVAKGRWRPADDGAAADLFDAAQQLTAAAGLPAYEISNHAAPGHRAAEHLRAQHRAGQSRAEAQGEGAAQHGPQGSLHPWKGSGKSRCSVRTLRCGLDPTRIMPATQRRSASLDGGHSWTASRSSPIPRRTWIRRRPPPRVSRSSPCS